MNKIQSSGVGAERSPPNNPTPAGAYVFPDLEKAFLPRVALGSNQPHLYLELHLFSALSPPTRFMFLPHSFYQLGLFFFPFPVYFVSPWLQIAY